MNDGISISVKNVGDDDEVVSLIPLLANDNDNDDGWSWIQDNVIACIWSNWGFQ